MEDYAGLRGVTVQTVKGIHRRALEANDCKTRSEWIAMYVAEGLVTASAKVGQVRL